MSNRLALTKKKIKLETLLKDLETEGNPKNTVIEPLLTTGVAVGGSQLGRMIGRPSLLIGLAAVGYGFYKNSNRATILGASMIAGGGFAALNGLNGSVSQKISTGIKDIGADLKHRLYLDKLFKPKEKAANTSATTNGLGNIEYFKYPKQEGKTEVGALEGGELDLGALDAIEDEIARSS